MIVKKYIFMILRLMCRLWSLYSFEGQCFNYSLIPGLCCAGHSGVRVSNMQAVPDGVTASITMQSRATGDITLTSLQCT